MPPAQTPAQRQAAFDAAGLNPAQQAAVVAGKVYTPPAPPGGGSFSSAMSSPSPAPAVNPPTPPAPTGGLQPGNSPSNAGKTGFDIFGNPVGGAQSANPDSSFAQAQSNIAPAAPQTEEEFYASIQEQLAPVLSKISDAEMAAETAATVKANQATSALNFGANSRGLAGSSEASSEASDITLQKGADVAAALQTQANALEAVAQFAIPEAFTAFKDAQTRNDTNSQAYIAQQKTAMNTALSGLAASGLSLTDLQTTNPAEYQQLLQYAGGDPNSLAALYLQASSAALLNNGQPVTTAGSTLIYGIKGVDANGQPTIKTISVGLPQGVPASYKMTVNTTTALGGIFTQYAPVGADGVSITDPTQVRSYLNGQQIAGPGTPPGQTAGTVTDAPAAVQGYIDGIKNGTITSIASVPAQYKSQVVEGMAQQNVTSPLADSRFTMAVNRIVSNFIALPGYQLTANGLPYLQRIQAAEKTPGSVSDQDLLDSMTKLNTSGNALSDAQVKVITDGQSYSDWAAVISQKLGTGGVLSQDQRDQIATIASSIFANYQQGYQPIYDQVTKQLTEAGIPSDYWTIPDLNALYKGQTGTTAFDSSGGASVQPAGTVVTYNGQQYTVGADGNTLTPVSQ